MTDSFEYKLANRKIIMYPDLSVTGRLFGGKLLSWIDEGMAMLAMGVMQSQDIVTKKISEVNFEAPGKLGDILEIWGKEEKRGRSSLTMHGKVMVRRAVEGKEQLISICNCTIVFVAIGENGRPCRWG
ncbi:MAG: acyl-CoA thioesterase [Lentisphaeraceae bacterium]|nr:acyl-CoA thioesterase [Lentisphaeraceae bacterium]